ncbi:K+/H+ antiporter subunit F [Paenirhodobacter sp.]|uniref:K+/H+ antiporter subunit F n=1 Tax=Paenirhodobacter sp. TaxID=1965326 RepID=UPI003B3DDF4D
MSATILSLALVYAQVALAVAALICAARLIHGPRAQDRVLAADSLYACTLLLFIVSGMRMGTGFFFEAAVVMAAMGFITSVALAKFLFRGEVIE